MATRILEVLEKVSGTQTIPGATTAILVNAEGEPCDNVAIGFGRIFGYVKVVAPAVGGPFGNVLVEQGLDDATITDIVDTVPIPTVTAVRFSRKVRGKCARVRVQNTTVAPITVRFCIGFGIFPEAETP